MPLLRQVWAMPHCLQVPPRVPELPPCCPRRFIQHPFRLALLAPQRIQLSGPKLYTLKFSLESVQLVLSFSLKMLVIHVLYVLEQWACVGLIHCWAMPKLQQVWAMPLAYQCFHESPSFHLDVQGDSLNTYHVGLLAPHAN